MNDLFKFGIILCLFWDTVQDWAVLCLTLYYLENAVVKRSNLY